MRSTCARLGVGVLMSLVSLVGCKDPTESAPASRDDEADRRGRIEASRAFRQKAQVDALQRLAPQAAEVFVLADPVAASQAADRPLAAPALGASGREALRPELERVWREAAGIETELLSPRDQTVLKTIRFGLSRIRDRIQRRRPAVTDPRWVLGEAERLLDEVRWRAARGRCDASCWTSVQTLAAKLEPSTRELGAAALPWVEAALRDLEELERESARPPTASDEAKAAFEALGQAFRATRAYLEQVREHLATAPVQEDVEISTLGPASNPEAVVRLAPSVPSAEFRRRLEVEEAITTSIESLYGEVGQALGRLRALAHKDAGGEKASSEPAPLTEERCREAWAPIASWVEDQPALKAATLDCKQALATTAASLMTDVELTRFVIEQGVVLPTERARRAEELDAIAMVSGRVTPSAHRLALGIAVASAIEDAAVRATLVEAGMLELCTSAAALWIHGGLGDDAALHERLDRYCPAPATRYLEAARARPRAALEGLGMIRIGTGPADVIALERFWWAPLGLLDDLANPANVAPAPAPPVEVDVEALEPDP